LLDGISRASGLAMVLGRQARLLCLLGLQCAVCVSAWASSGVHLDDPGSTLAKLAGLSLPEPAPLLLLGGALIGVAVILKRKLPVKAKG